MAQYLALIYTADVDWWAPEQAAELAAYRQFAVEPPVARRTRRAARPRGPIRRGRARDHGLADRCTDRARAPLP